MERDVNGELVPLGGGDAIPLVRPLMTVGRRESCDICLRFPNVSGLHCELSFRDGYWFIRDMGSSNGLKINGARQLQKPLSPGDELAISNHRFLVHYDISAQGQQNLESKLGEEEGLRSQSLLEKAGLAKPRGHGDD